MEKLEILPSFSVRGANQGAAPPERDLGFP
jgi:hypothetical protein